MDVKAAFEIAKQGMEGRVLARCLDAGDRWIFCFEQENADDLTPGDFPVTVDKATGKPGYLPIPPIENLQVLKAGKAVPVKALKINFQG